MMQKPENGLKGAEKVKEQTNTRLLNHLFFRLLPLQILLAVTEAVNGIVSSLFAANYVGEKAMSAIGLFGPISMFLSAVGLMLVGGSQLKCGEYMGKQQVEHTQGVFTADLAATTGISLLSAVLLVAAVVTGFTRGMTNDREVLRPLNEYFLGQAAGIPPMLLGQQLSAFLSLENKKRLTTLAGIVFIIVNLAMNILLVAVLRMGALGLALASSAGLWAFFGVQAWYYIAGKSMLKFRFRPFSFRDLKDILKIGYPGALCNGYQTLRGQIVNMLIVLYVGSAGLSAFAASGAVLGIFWAVPSGVQAVSRMLISVFLGEEDRQSLKDSMKIGIRNGVLIQAVFSALLILLAEPLTRLYFRDPTQEVYRLTVSAFRILPLCMVLSVISMHFTSYAQASGKHLLVHLLSVVDGVIGVALFSLILVPAIGMDGVYWANVINGVICALVVFFYAWAARKKCPRSLEDLMVIPEDFGAEEQNRIDISVKEIGEVETISLQVIGFCRERGVDERRSFFAGLALEEMAGNVVEHGFHEDRKKHSVDIRVVRKGEDVILRIKDDCRHFDPEERRNIVDPEDGMKNVGIRLAYSCAGEIRYANFLGMNVLTIRI